MRNPLYSVIAQIVMEDLEDIIIKQIDYIIFCGRYVNDLFMITKHENKNQCS